MKTLLTKLSLLSLVLMMGLASCTEEDPTGPGGNGVTKLSANARSSSAINVRWENGSASDTLYVTSPAGVTTKYVATQGTTYNTAIATGLSANQNYTLTVHNASGASSNLTWATAARWPEAGGSVQIFSTADPSPNNPSGLIIDASGITPMSVNSATRKDEIDIVLAANDLTQFPNTPVSVLSPGIDGSGIITTKRTFFGEPFNVAGGLDNDYYTDAINTLIAKTGTKAYNSIDLTTRSGEAVGTSTIIPFLTDDGHYGRIELVPNATTGQVYTTVGGIESIQVKVSYQTQMDNGYVGRGTARGPWVRNGVSIANAPMKR